MPLLLVEKGNDRGGSYTIEAEGDCLVGRDAVCQLRLKDPMTSRRHFRVRGDGTRFQIQDLGSRNGTFLNGTKILEDFIQVDDKVQVGQTIISLLRDSAARRKGPLTGRSLGGYLFQERVGRGGMGTVYRARQISLDRSVAVKVLSPELTKDPAFVELFVREARAAGRLAHPNVVEVYDVVVEDGVHFYSMELVEGGNVQELLCQIGPLPSRRALEIVLGATRALEYAERNRVIHRDVKPDNLMITETGTVKICDLGIARSAAEGGRVVQAEGISGSPQYMAPEQGAGQPIDHRADIYSLGVSLFEMLTGTTPFTGSSHAELIGKHIREQPPTVRSFRPEIPRAVPRLVERMMAKRPDDRFQSATELADASRKLIGSLRGDEVRAAGGVGTGAVRSVRPLLWVFLILALGVAALLSHNTRARARARRDHWLLQERSWRERRIALARDNLDLGRFDAAEGIALELTHSPDPGERNRADWLLWEIRHWAQESAKGEQALNEAFAYGKSHPEDLQGLQRRLQEVYSRFPGDRRFEEKNRKTLEPHLKRVREALRSKEEKDRLEATRLDERRKILGSAVEEVETLCGDGEYRAAVARIETFRQEHPEMTREADILERKVHDEAWATYRSVESEARRLRSDGRLVEAVETLQEAEATMVMDEIREKASALRVEIEAEREERDRKEKEEQDRADGIRFEKSKEDARQEAAAHRIRTAIELLQEGRGSLSGIAYRKNYDWRIAHLERILGVMDRIREYTRGGGGGLYLDYKDGRRWDILKADGEGITIRKVGSGEAELLIPWGAETLGWNEIRRICRSIPDLTARDRLNLYALCREFPDAGEASTEKREVNNLLKVKDDPEVRRALLDYAKNRW